jgi:hypothetical protein
LGRTKDGPLAKSLRKAVIIYVLSSVLYGSEVWYASRNKLIGYFRNGSPKIVSTKLGEHVKMVRNVIAHAAHEVLPV